MSTECIKERTPSWSKFNLLLETVDLDSETEHLVIVDIEFDYKNILYNEILPPIIEKQKILHTF